jgi:CO/xanthine dehydrogenase FAD-binding subunit
MKAVDFDYVRAASIGEACRLLAAAGEDGKLLAGGQTLVPLLAMRLARPSVLVDINGIADLHGIELGRDHLLVRACTRQAAALADDGVRRHAPLLAKALAFVGHDQTRNRGTVGGSLANADPAAEIGLAALALDAEIMARSSAGERRIAVAAFFTGPMTTVLAPGECLTAVRFPRRPQAGRFGTGFQEMSVRRSDFALVAVAVELALEADGVCRRIALSVGGAGGMPLRVAAVAARLVGTRLADGDLEAAAEILRDAIEPQTDIHASADYRRRLAGALAARALAEARGEALAGRA